MHQLGGYAEWRQALIQTSGSMIGMIPSGMVLLTSVALTVSVIRLASKKAMVKDLYCIEMLARVNVLCLDKTGTITDGTMTVETVLCEESGLLYELMPEFISATGEKIRRRARLKIISERAESLIFQRSFLFPPRGNTAL